LGGEARLRRLARHGQAAAVVAELPAVVGAEHARVVDAAEEERGPAVRAKLADEAGPPALAPESDERLAEETHPLDPPARLELSGLHHGDPAAAGEGAPARGA